MKTKMPTKERRAWLAAIGKLKRFYRAVLEGKKPHFWKCPLCQLSSSFTLKNYDSRMCYCPWTWFEKIYCQEKDAGTKRENHDIPWAKDSLKRLDRWRKRLEAK